MLNINGYVDPTSGKFIQLSPSDITSTRINVTNAEFLSKVKFSQSLIIGNTGISGFDFELPTATTPGIIKTSNPGLNKLNFSNGLGTSDIQLGGIKAPTADNDAANKKYVDDSITTQVSSVYKTKGSITDLTALATPDKAHEGFVYNIENEFTTTDQFVEGAGKTYPAGTNVVIVNITGTEYKYDVLAGMVDLSNYATKTDLSGKLDKVTSVGTYRRAYAIMPNGTGYIQEIDYNAIASTLALRDSNGALRAATPTASSGGDIVATKKYADTQVATKQAKFAEYTSTRPSEEAPASASTNILVLNEGMEFYLRDRATNPLVEFKIDDAGVLQGTTNNLSLTTKNAFNLKSNIFILSNDKGTPFQIVMDDSKKIVYYGLNGGDDNGSLYLTDTSRTAQQGATLQGNVSSDSRTTALVVNESNTKLLSWKQGTTTNNAPLLGVSTPVATADTSKGITADDLDYQAVNKKYVDDIKTELLNAITHPYTYDETTKELTLIL